MDVLDELQHIERLQKAGLTHKQVENLVDNLMVKQGWVRVKNQHHLFHGRYPDRLFARGDDILVIEIKPENARDSEILKGLGQMTCYLPYQVKPYLVLPEKWADVFREVIRMLPDIGILQYSPVGEMVISQKPVRNMAGLQKLELLKFINLEVTRELLWKYLKTITSDGLYSLDFLEDGLRMTYPTIAVERQTVARLLKSMGYGRKKYDPETMKPSGKGRIYFVIDINYRLGAISARQS